MKRVILLVVLVMLAYWILKADQGGLWGPYAPPGHRNGPLYAQRDAKPEVKVKARKRSRPPIDEVRQAVHQARDEFQHAINEARDEFRQAIDEVRDEFRQAVDEPQVVTASDDGPPPVLPPGYQAPTVGREHAEGLPVPIVPGTRVTDALAQPPVAAGSATRISHLEGESFPKNTKERAEAEARQKLREAIASWLDPDVPRSWTPPDDLLNSLGPKTRFEPYINDFGAHYVAHIELDPSPIHRARLLEVYNRELVGRRLFKLGGSLSFILICLAAISGYIRADEATKGYYTNRLRMLAAAGVGAGGVILYQMFA